MKANNDIFAILMPVYIISRILGLAPFKLQNKTFTPSYGVLEFLKFGVVVGGLIYAIVLINQLSYKQEIHEIALRCELYLGTCMTIVILILAIVKQKALIRVLQKLIAIDEHFRRSEISPIYKHCTKFTVFQVVVITCTFTLKLILQVLNNVKASLLVYGVFNIIDYINATMLLQIINLLLLIHQRFVWLNRKLENLSQSTDISLYISEKKLTTLKPIIVGVSKQVRPEVLLIQLGKIYSELCEESRLINKTFNIQILLTLVCRFIMLTAQLVNVYNIIRSSKKDCLQTVSESVYVMLHAFVIFVLASVAGETASQAKITGVYLHNIWGCIPSLRNEIEYFSLQILHQNLTFTACEFFTLDKALIYGVVGAVTTYLIIVIQLERG